MCHSNIIYCISPLSYTIYSYQANKDIWAIHSRCPYQETALTFINGNLTAIGGQDSDLATNKVLSWMEGSWEEEIPPMTRARYRHAAVTDGGHTVVVAGGWEEESVEVFTGSSWSSVTKLPEYLRHITATLCGDLIYVMNYCGIIYTSSLTTLLSTQATDKATPSMPVTPLTWHPLNTAPVEWSTLSTIGSQVVVVGGVRGVTPTADVHGLISQQWTRIGCMNTARSYPIVAVVNGENCKMVVVVGSASSNSSSVEQLCY